MIYAVSLLIVVTAVQGWVLWRLVCALGGLGRIEERISRCAQGLALLVDTSETGFAALGNELTRMGAAPPSRASAQTTTRRIVAATRRGKSVAVAAASAGVSEGEAQLRLLLRNSRGAMPPSKERHDAMRA